MNMWALLMFLIKPKKYFTNESTKTKSKHPQKGPVCVLWEPHPKTVDW